MPLLTGIILAVGVAAFARIVGFDRDRSFYPVVLTVIASLYILFAAIGGAGASIEAELIPFLFFTGLAVAGFKASPWFAAAGLALHGIFDFVRAPFLPNAGVPEWWPEFCAGYDLAAGLVLAVMIASRRIPAELRGRSGDSR